MKRNTITSILRFAVLICAAFIMMGCTKYIYVPKVHTESIIDTVVMEIPDSATIRALFECDSLGQVRLREFREYKGREASQDFSFLNGEMRVITKWRTQYIDRLKEVHDTTTVVDIVEVTKEVNVIPKFYQFILWWFIGSAMLLIAYIGFRFLKR